jgi:hypothetical protein
LTDLHFFRFFSLDGKLFATSKFSDENFFERKLALLSFFRLIWFLSDRLFLLHKSFFEKTLKKREKSVEGVKIQVKYFFLFLLIRNQKTDSITEFNYFIMVLYNLFVKIENFEIPKKSEKTKFWHIVKKIFFHKINEFGSRVDLTIWQVKLK